MTGPLPVDGDGSWPCACAPTHNTATSAGWASAARWRMASRDGTSDGFVRCCHRVAGVIRLVAAHRLARPGGMPRGRSWTICRAPVGAVVNSVGFACDSGVHPERFVLVAGLAPLRVLLLVGFGPPQVHRYHAGVEHLEAVEEA